ncbi:MarR family transcriptional regulator [Jannaschia formosa]|nr:MarR family transcriptional regulator [Jannaschia formosa]
MAGIENFDLGGFLPYLLTRAAEVTSQGFASYYKDRYGMLRTEWRVLFHLGRYGEMTARTICDRAGLHKTPVSRAVAALERKGLLSRQTDPRDRRHERLSLTARGGTVFDDLVDAARRYDEALSEQFTAREREVLGRCLGKLAGMQPRMPIRAAPGAGVRW